MSDTRRAGPEPGTPHLFCPSQEHLERCSECMATHRDLFAKHLGVDACEICDARAATCVGPRVGGGDPDPARLCSDCCEKTHRRCTPIVLAPAEPTPVEPEDTKPVDTMAPIRAGDVVKPNDLDEEWVVAYADHARGILSWCGWPAGTIDIDQVTLVKRCTDEEHKRTVLEIGNTENRGDHRRHAVRRLHREFFGPWRTDVFYPGDSDGEIRWTSGAGGYSVLPWMGKWSWRYEQARDGFASRDDAEADARAHEWGSDLAIVAPPDGAPPAEVLAALRVCASCCEPEARLVGNVRAGDIVRMCDALAATCDVRGIAPESRWLMQGPVMLCTSCGYHHPECECGKDGAHWRAVHAEHRVRRATTPQPRVHEYIKAAPLRTFTVYRRGDLSETHNADQANPPDQPQFEGVLFSDGKVAQRWLTPMGSTSVWDSFEAMWRIHGHDEPGSKHGTVIVWHDGGESP